jgi:Flp pilus assembly pilin Flp
MQRIFNIWDKADRLTERVSQAKGQGLAEYALILALIAMIAILALMFMGGSVSKILSSLGNSV